MSMECPYCGCELRLADEEVVASAPRVTAQTTCASPRCARELWAELPSAEGAGDAGDAEVRLLKVPPAMAVDRPPLGKRAVGEVVAAMVIAVAATVFAVVVGVRYVSWPDPGPVRTEAELMGLAALGAVALAAGLLLDGTLRRRRHVADVEVPRVELVLLALPKGYRA